LWRCDQFSQSQSTDVIDAGFISQAFLEGTNMETRSKITATFVGLVGVFAAASVSAATYTAGRGTTMDERTVVHSRPLDECSAALNRNWNRLAQLQNKEDQLRKPPVAETASADVTEMAHK
jgi:hypothetical protein